MSVIVMGFSTLWQVCLSAGFTMVTQRSVNNFGFLIGEVYGSSVNFQWANGGHKM